MKKLTVILATIAILSLAINVKAQEYEDEATIQLGVKGGWSFWYEEPLSESVDNNWIVGGELKVWFENNFGVGGEVQYTTKDEIAEDIDLDIDLEYTQLPIHANAFYRFPMEDMDSTYFYLGAGASFIYADATSSAMVDGETVELVTDDTAFGVNGVAGYQYERFFVEGQWIWAEADFQLAGVDVEEDVQLGGPRLWIGVRF